MKKNILLTSILVSLLIILPMISITQAFTEVWTGAEVKTYTWETTAADNATLQEITVDLLFGVGASYRYYAFTEEMVSEIAEDGMTVEVDVTDVALDQMDPTYGEASIITGQMTTTIGDDIGVVAALTYDVGRTVPIADESNTANLDIQLQSYYKYAVPTYILDWMIPNGYGWAADAGRLYNLFAATNTNWTYILSNWNSTLQGAAMTYGTDFTLEQSGIGFHIWYNVSVTNPWLTWITGFSTYNQQKTLDLTYEFDNNGVLNYSSVSYGGVVAHTLEPKVASPPPPTPGIPGYELISILGVSTTAVVTIVFIVKRKRFQK
ncbi:MAG: hypothetical protein ACTSV5_07375 [Promethearchaeota archaeon]